MIDMSPVYRCIIRDYEEFLKVESKTGISGLLARWKFKRNTVRLWESHLPLLKDQYLKDRKVTVYQSDLQLFLEFISNVDIFHRMSKKDSMDGMFIIDDHVDCMYKYTGQFRSLILLSGDMYIDMTWSLHDDSDGIKIIYCDFVHGISTIEPGVVSKLQAGTAVHRIIINAIYAAQVGVIETMIKKKAGFTIHV